MAIAGTTCCKCGKHIGFCGGGIMLNNRPHDHSKCGEMVYNSASGKHYCPDCASKFRVGDAGRMRKSIEEIAKRVNTKVWKKKHPKR